LFLETNSAFFINNDERDVEDDERSGTKKMKKATKKSHLSPYDVA
jgi:hypothetical protein